jgi:hypothetical protein
MLQIIEKVNVFSTVMADRLVIALDRTLRC